jgi:hypothetical protein
MGCETPEGADGRLGLGKGSGTAYEDGVEGELDLAPHIVFHGVFEPLKDPDYFAQVRVDSDLGSVTWPNGADLDPDVLYARLTGIPALSAEDLQMPRK